MSRLLVSGEADGSQTGPGAGASSPTIASAPGKVNLALWSGTREESGYHPLTTVFEAVGLREYVEIRQRESAWSEVSEGMEPGTLEEGSDAGSIFAREAADRNVSDRRFDPRIHVKTMVYRLPDSDGEPRFDVEATRAFGAFDGPSHLALRAVSLLAPSGASVDVFVHKVLPVAGGMAGGSADAAAALVGANAHFGLQLSPADLQAAGARLGADVPACLVGGVCLGLGRGDQMETLGPGTPRPRDSSRWWCLAFADEGLSTPLVFAEFDRLCAAGDLVSAADAETVPGLTLSGGDHSALTRSGTDVAPALRNDLAGAALSLRPELGEVGAACLQAGAASWMVSGSGPTVAALCASRAEARHVAERVRSRPGVRATAVTWGPDVGACLEEALPSWCVRR